LIGVDSLEGQARMERSSGLLAASCGLVESIVDADANNLVGKFGFDGSLAGRAPRHDPE
jgi:hypothetical protein